MPSAYLENLKRAVEAMHGCKATYLTSGMVHEKSGHATVWRGTVDTFALKGHPTASRAFAWGWRDRSGQMRYSAVLNVAPIQSPLDAVRAEIARGRLR